jgi:nuclear transport factor 2 (NTF2) superfamily protein
MCAAQTTTQRSPLPPFTRETAIQKVRLAEDAWNSRDPEKVALAYTVDSRWRNRSEFVNGRQEIVAFSQTQMDERAGLSANQRALGRRGKSYRRALRL